MNMVFQKLHLANGVYTRDEIKMWKRVFDTFLEELKSENGMI